ncbi:MAG TPA: hypothetical protein VMW10_03570 [Alphaproteobacteria bacterium]|nr:hypothetical protein [Alphaproteobacteria bacterium]
MLEKISEFKMLNYTIKKGLSPLSRKLEKMANRTASEAIAKHKAIENPIYYKEKGKLIKELADGTRYLVKVTIDGIKTIEKFEQ